MILFGSCDLMRVSFHSFGILFLIKLRLAFIMDFNEKFGVFLLFFVPIEKVLGYFILKFIHFDELKVHFTFLHCFILIL